jgi:hypothetical protein
VRPFEIFGLDNCCLHTRFEKLSSQKVVDEGAFRVYFYTRMQHENVFATSQSPFSKFPVHGGSTSLPSSADLPMTPLARTFIRHGSVEHLESLFSRLKDGALLIAALSYGLELPVSDVCSARVRDVNIASQSVVIRGRVHQVPKMVLEDLRDYLQEKLCGYEASVSLSKRDQPLFSEAERGTFQREVLSWWRVFKLTREHSELGVELCLAVERPESVLKDVDSTARLVNKALGLIGRAHLYRAQRRNTGISSALELFDKGPRIVRRNRYGAVTAYYVWRARAL